MYQKNVVKIHCDYMNFIARGIVYQHQSFRNNYLLNKDVYLQFFFFFFFFFFFALAKRKEAALMSSCMIVFGAIP